MSGVGSPGQVEAPAEAILGRAPLQHFDFSDHHSYDPVEIQAMLKIAAAPVPVVCTAKDAVKLGRMRDVWGLTPVWVLETGVQFGPALAVNAIATSSATFADWWQEWWSAKRSRKLPTGGGHVV